MNIFRYLVVLITLSINVHGAIPQETAQDTIQLEIQGDKAHKDVTTLTTTFIHQELLTPEQKINLYRITKAWQQAYETFKDECLQNNPLCQHHALLLTMFTDILKQAILKLQILMVTPTKQAISNKHLTMLAPRALTDGESSTILLNVLTILHTWHKQQWELDHISTLITNHDITTTIYNTLPTDIKRSWIGNLIAGNNVYDALKINLYEDFPSFAHDYVDCIITYKSLKKTATAESIATLEQSIDTLMHTLQQFNATTPLHSIQAQVLRILGQKLFQISVFDIPFAKQLTLLAQKNPSLLTLFKRHECLVQSDAFAAFSNAMPTATRTFIESYLTLTHHFFSNEHPLSESFVYELENVSYHLQHLPENHGKGILKRAWSGTTSSEQIIDEMHSIITDMLAQCSATPATATSSGSIISYITSGKWLNNGALKQVSQQTNGNIILDFANQLIGQKQFSDFKTAGLYALIYASPFLLVKLIKLAWPWLSNDLKTQLTGIVGTNDSANNHDKLMTFVSQNPDLIKQVCDKHPEVLNSIAQALKQQVITT